MSSQPLDGPGRTVDDEGWEETLLVSGYRQGWHGIACVQIHPPFRRFRTRFDTGIRIRGSMPTKIIVRLSGNDDPQSEHVFDKDEIHVGRSLTNDVVLPDMQKKVSGKHAKLELKSGRYWLTDLGSTNGTFLNNRRISANTPVQISNEETLGIGNFQLQFTATLELQGATQRHVDPSKVAEALSEQLNALYAQHREDPPEMRKEVMAALLRDRLELVSSEESRAVLAVLKNRFSSSSGGGDENESDISKQEALYRSGYTWIQGISRHFLGEDSFESADQVERFSKQIQQTIESTVTWVSRSLKGRREFENEFSADLTMVFSKEGNPLKSAAGPSELGKYLLDWRSSRDLETSRDLLENAYKDLTMHQLGLVAGVQDCLKALLQQLDPKVLQHSVLTENSGGLAKLLLNFSLSKKSWGKYTRRHKELFENNSKLFNELIYPELRKGYLGHHATEEAADPPTNKPAPPPKPSEQTVPDQPGKTAPKATPPSKEEK